MRTLRALLLACTALLVTAPAFAFGGSHWTSWAHRPWIVRDEPGVVMWIRADQGITLNAGKVATWADFSGQASDFSATGTEQPLFVASAQNGQPAVRFDGVNDNMATGAVTRTRPRDIYTVVKYVTIGGSGALYNDATTTDTLQFNQDNSPEYFTQSGAFGPFIGASMANGVYATLRTTFTATGSTIFVNGTQTGTVGTAMNSGTGWRIGSNTNTPNNKYANAEIGEFIEFNALLSTAEAARIQSYLKTFWGTP